MTSFSRWTITSRVVSIAVFGMMLSPATQARVPIAFSSYLGQPSGENMSVDEALVRMSEKMNRSMPQVIDTDTRLDKVTAASGRQIAYHFTMINVGSKDISTANFYKTFRPTLEKRVCAAEDLKMFFRNRVSVAYAYQGTDGQDIGKIVFSPKDCGYKS